MTLPSESVAAAVTSAQFGFMKVTSTVEPPDGAEAAADVGVVVVTASGPPESCGLMQA